MCLITSNSMDLTVEINIPKDAYLTPVCTTEFIAFAQANTYFQKLNAELIGLSIDSTPSHLAWIRDIYNRTGITIPFPVISDRNGQIARKYGMISNDVSTTATVRTVFIIDPNGRIRLIMTYPLNVGRSIPEIVRSLQALQIADSNMASTPANWVPCQQIIVPSPNTYRQLEERISEIDKNRNGVSWYLSFKSPENCEQLNISNEQQLGGNQIMLQQSIN